MSKELAKDRRPGLHRRVGAMVLGGMSLACMLGGVYAYAGCTRTTKRHSGTSDAVTNEGRRMLGEQPQDGGELVDDATRVHDTCVPVVVEVAIQGSFQELKQAPGGDVHGPKLSVQYRLPDDASLEAHLHNWVEISIARPYFATSYSMQDLCSTEQASPSYLRIACLRNAPNHSENDQQPRRAVISTIEYRVEENRRVTILVDSDVVPLSLNKSYNTPFPPNTCATLRTEIPKRDLEPLRSTYANNNASERCRVAAAPRRKVLATLLQEPFPPGHELHEMSKLEYHELAKRYCRGVTQVKLSLPASTAPSQNMGILGAQCSSLCSVSREVNPAHVYVACFEGGSVEAYQLGDHLYVVDDDHVRQIPLPCNIELDFRTADLAVQLGLPKPHE